VIVVLNIRLLRDHNSSLARLLVEGVERSAQSFQSAAYRLGIAAEAYAEVLRLLEKFSRHYAGLKLLAQHGDKFVGAADAKPWKDSGAEAAGFAVYCRVFRQEFIDQSAIGGKQITGAITNPIEIIERNRSEKFGWVYGTAIGEVNDLPHALDELRLRQNPSAADAAQAVSFGEAAGDDEV